MESGEQLQRKPAEPKGGLRGNSRSLLLGRRREKGEEISAGPKPISTPRRYKATMLSPT